MCDGPLDRIDEHGAQLLNLFSSLFLCWRPTLTMMSRSGARFHLRAKTSSHDNHMLSHSSTAEACATALVQGRWNHQVHCDKWWTCYCDVDLSNFEPRHKGRGCLQEARPRTPLQTIALMMCSWGLSPKTEPFATQPLTVMEGSMALETGMILSTVANADLI